RLHGDAHLANFMIKDEKVYIIDCKFNKNKLTKLKQLYEFVELDKSCDGKMKFQEKKKMGYKVVKKIDEWLDFYNYGRKRGMNKLKKIEGLIMSKILFYLRNKVTIDKGNSIQLGKKNKIRDSKIKIRGKNNILILKDSANLSGVNIEIRGTNCTLEIGEKTVIGNDTYISVKGVERKVIIGERCMFSRNIVMMTYDGHEIYENGVKISEPQDIIIGNKVWLADKVILLKGSQVSDGSIVGINSLVTKKFTEKNILLVGNPAKKIKENINWEN
ncbi:MAG: hypothetical protein ACRC5T_09665, partial [Cetobacterium sp.]